MPIEVRRHPRAKRFVLRVSGGVIQLTIPTRARIGEAASWARSQAAFVEKRLAGEPEARPFVMGETVPVLGEELEIVQGLKVHGEREAGRWAIAPAAPDALAKRMEQGLRKVALLEGERALKSFWQKLGVPDGDVSVRAYKRRWGACGSDGSTALNWRLVFAPRFVFDYVAAHEAAHRLEMNHSRRFWSIVEELDPKYPKAERWLKDHGASLYAYGASLDA
ncbi:M48 family metallopeptidase [Parvularcula sp. ZS-1/3]|uniref:M48 family metallopeptidase n=1 Tax=Parvularcula mediterranea TaxID=2732508 RepID=A0A7Y3RNP6_9PROT|nr:M48 family metallopeptidase [Parvularcula mediterranea]